jgi:hypothetical protein
LASNREKETLEHSVRRVLILQSTLTVLLVLSVFAYGIATEGMQQGIYRTAANAIACGYGALLGIAATLLTRRSVNRSSEAAMRTPQFAMLPVYMGLLNKLLIVGGGLGIGLVTLGLAPIFVVSGFLVTQLALIWVAARPA